MHSFQHAAFPQRQQMVEIKGERGLLRLVSGPPHSFVGQPMRGAMRTADIWA